MAAHISHRIPWRSLGPIVKSASRRPTVPQCLRAPCAQRRNASDDYDDFTRGYLEDLENKETKSTVVALAKATAASSSTQTSQSQSAVVNPPVESDPAPPNQTKDWKIVSFLYNSPALSLPPNAFNTAQTAVSHQTPRQTPTRMPRAVQAVYLRPMKRQATYGLPVCNLQFRSYNIRNLEFFCDFALRAAYYLNLPAYGPLPLPKITRRWTVPKGHFIHAKKKENYERITFRRVISIKDGSAEGVELWLAFLRKHAYYGVGMKATVWEFAGTSVGKDMDAQMEAMRTDMEGLLGHFAFKEGSAMADKVIDKVNEEYKRQTIGYSAPMIDTPNWKRPLNWGAREEGTKKTRGPDFKQVD